MSVAVEWGLTSADEDLDILLRPAYRNGTSCDPENWGSYDDNYEHYGDYLTSWEDYWTYNYNEGIINFLLVYSLNQCC